MQVTVISTWFPSEAAPGSGIFNLRDAELLAERHEVRVIHLSSVDSGPGSWVTATGIPVTRLAMKPMSPTSVRAAAAQLRPLLEGSDLIHSMAFSTLFPLARFAPKVPWVHTEHWSGFLMARPPLTIRAGRALARKILNRPDRVVAVSPSLAQGLAPWTREEPVVIPNAVLRPVGDKTRAWREDGTLKLVAVGGVTEWKGAEIAVRSVALLRNVGVDAMLTWVGVGPLTATVQALSEELGIAEHVEFLGHREPEDLSRILLAQDLFLLPTRGETFGVALAEAMRHGLPVVSGAVGGHVEFLPSAGARLVSVRSPEEFVRATQDLINDENRLTAPQIMHTADQLFSEARRAIAYETVYQDAQSRHERAG